MTSFHERTNPYREPWKTYQDTIADAADTAALAHAEALETATQGTTTLTAISIPTTATATVGQTRAALVVTPTPSGVVPVVTWSSGTPAKATVNAVTGAITGVAAGDTVITATSVADPTLTDTCTVTVS